LDPETFWEQTPRSFVSIMEGRARAAKRRSDAMLAHAWHVEAFARQKKLKPLREMIDEKPKAQTPDEMLSALMGFRARGANMSIKKLH
jgi:hypothetical protein